jgi:predicted DNA binding CopG/RHH family protein
VTSQLAIRLTAADRQALQELAEADGMPISTYIVSVLRRHLLNGEAS